MEDPHKWMGLCWKRTSSSSVEEGPGLWSAPDDSVELAVQDLLKSGGNLGDPGMLKILVEESGARILDLEAYGARFDKDEHGKFIVGQLAGHSRPRTLTFIDRKV